MTKQKKERLMLAEPTEYICGVCLSPKSNHPKDHELRPANFDEKIRKAKEYEAESSGRVERTKAVLLKVIENEPRRTPEACKRSLGRTGPEGSGRDR